MSIVSLLAIGLIGAIGYHYFVTLKKRAERVATTGRVAVITGCDQGFGAGLAKKLYDAGCTVFATCYTEDAVNKYNTQYQGDKRFFAVQMDVTSEESVNNAKEQIQTLLQNELSLNHIDVLVNNAGIWIGSLTELTPMSQYRRSMEVNYFGMINVTKTFLSLLKQSPSAERRILNICSIAGRMSSHSIGAYSASKHAAEAFTVALRQEMSEWNIKVVMYEPGLHGTALLPVFQKNLVDCYERSPKEIRDQYGENYLQHQLKSFQRLTSLCTGHPDHVVDALVEGALSVAPKQRYVIGMDAKYGFAPAITLLPDWVNDFALTLICDFAKPAGMIVPSS